MARTGPKPKRPEDYRDQRTVVYLDRALVKHLKATARKRGTTVSSVVHDALTEWRERELGLLD